MKKILLGFIIAWFGLNAKAQTNVYHPFPDTIAVWNETSWFVNNVTLTYYNTPTVYFLAGDTVISTLHYKKILSSGYTISSNYPFPTSGYFNNQYAGAIRQDSIHKKIYFCKPSTTIDTLLYDFNLYVGDTLPTSYINYHGSNYVSSIDSILIGNGYRKQYHITAIGSSCLCASNYDSLIEGIGSTMGLLYPIIIPSEAGSYLNCFSQNNTVMYVNPNQSCDSTLGIQIHNKQLTFQIYPNPASNSFQVSLPGNNIETSISVYDMLGNKIKQSIIYTAQSIIDIAECNSGVYILELSNSKGKCVKQLIKE